MDNIIKIGIDGRCLEGIRTGTGRYLANLLKYFGEVTDARFYLYFKHEIPTDAYFREEIFTLRRLTPFWGIESNALFTHRLLPRALKRDGIDLLFAPSYIAPRLVPVPFVLTLHDISYEAHPEWTKPRDQALLRRVSRHAALRAKIIITVSEFSKKEIIRLYGIPEDRIVVTHLAADMDLGQPVVEADEKEILAKCGLVGDFVLSMGTLINRRMPLETLYGFAGAAKRIPTLQLLFVGSDRTWPALDVSGHIDRVNAALGRVAVVQVASANDRELSVLYRKAKMLIWLSSYEGFGLPPIEAMAAGIPVLTSHTSSLPEVVGGAAVRIGHPAGASSATGGVELDEGPTIGAVSDAIHRLFADEPFRQWLIAKGKERAAQFSWQKTAEATLAVLRECGGK